MNEVCPVCESAHVLPIVYGFPPSDVMDAARRGELVLGGCNIDESYRNFCCMNCKARFNSHGKDVLV